MRYTRQLRGGPLIAGICLLLICGSAAPAPGQPAERSEPAAPAETDGALDTPKRVEVQPVARDEEIEQRLTRILRATGWFGRPVVRVDEGVVFLEGVAAQEQYREWAGRLAQNTRDVVAVVNRIEVQSPSPWDFAPAVAGLRTLASDMVAGLPYLVFGALTLVVAWFLAAAVGRLLRPALSRRIAVALLREVIARAAGALIFVLGLYIVLKVSGLTRLAITVLGGTGLLGLVIGIAFRDITENFLASILLSIQRPFRVGDLVEIESTLGYVRQLNVRTTVLMTLTGNHVQIPNSTVYKAKITNYTSNANRREDFVVGIGYDVVIADAQQVALQVLAEHPAVLKEPEPWVLVDGLGASTVNLRVYFWLDGAQHSWLKVKSSVIRLIKRAFQEQGIDMPDEARELVFPRGVPVHLIDQRGSDVARTTDARPAAARESADVSVRAEAGLSAESEQIEAQARAARMPEQGENLLQ